VSEEQSHWRGIRGKIWKSLVALAALFGLLSPTGVRLSPVTVFFLIAAVVLFAVYWHVLDEMMAAKARWKQFFIELREDVKFIRAKVAQEDTHGPKR